MRFYSPDSLSPFDAGGLNSYAYCSGDPLNYSDPSGLHPVFHYLTQAKRSITRLFSPREKNHKPGVIDISQRDKQFRAKLFSATIEDVKKLNPKKNNALDSDVIAQIITVENHNSDSYNAVYQENKKITMYGLVMYKRGLLNDEIMKNWKTAASILKRFEDVEHQVRINMVRKDQKKRWTRPSAQKIFDRN